jgi:hypothetical protein
VEYQLDLRAPQQPVALGVTVLAEKGAHAQMALAGKSPRTGFTPPELSAVGPFGRSQLDGWVATMGKDLLSALEKREDPLETLASIWCWNLRVVIEPDVMAERGETARDVVARLCSERIGLTLPRGIFEPPIVSADGYWSLTEVAFNTR